MPAATKSPKLSPELSRFQRGAFLGSKRLDDDGRYEVKGSKQNHQVDIFNREHPTCDCPDFKIRGQTCKHIWAALIREGDITARTLLRELLTSLDAKG